MGGFFGTTLNNNCFDDLFYGTDYHCRLGTTRCGLATVNDSGFMRIIHDITNANVAEGRTSRNAV